MTEILENIVRNSYFLYETWNKLTDCTLSVTSSSLRCSREVSRFIKNCLYCLRIQMGLNRKSSDPRQICRAQSIKNKKSSKLSSKLTDKSKLLRLERDDITRGIVFSWLKLKSRVSSSGNFESTSNDFSWESSTLHNIRVLRFIKQVKFSKYVIDLGKLSSACLLLDWALSSPLLLPDGDLV